VRSTLPDVCKSPVVPVPYTNIAFAKDLARGTKTVFSHGGAMNGIKGSEFSVSIADEPGVGGGVISGVNMHRATWLSWSPDVFMEGKPVTRLTDRMLMNKGNTISAGGYFTGPVTGASKATLDLLCSLACNCIAAGTARQRCVHLAVKALPKTAGTGIYSEVTFDPSGQMMRHPDGAPMTRYATAGSRIDVVTVAGGAPVEFIEMKFGTDTMGDGQRERYERIARRNGRPLQEIWVDRDCKCDGGAPVPVPVPAPKDAGMTAGQKVAAGGAAVLILGGIACALAEPCGAAALGALLLGGGTLAATQ
jgi:Domain of unknown function (DUF4150)